MNFDNMSAFKKANLELMRDFDIFCKDNNIDYNISCGTAIGAVRHGGFIPWDDDIDVDMHIDEFKKFKKIWKKKGNKEKYFLQTKSSDLNLTSAFFRIRMNNTTCMQKSEFNIPLHLGIPLDIFPFYNAPKTILFQKIMVSFHRYSEKFANLNKRFYKSNIIFKYFTVAITNFFFSLICLISNFSKKSGLIYYPASWSKKLPIIKKDYLSPPKPIFFEDFEFLGPNMPHEYLTWTYGDYMKLPPEDKRYGHKIWIVDTENDYTEYLNGNLPLPKE